MEFLPNPPPIRVTHMGHGPRRIDRHVPVSREA